MNRGTWKVYGFWILLSEAVGALSGWLSRNAISLYTEAIQKSALSPPAVVFPVVWSVLFALMGIGAARISLAAPSRAQTRALRIFLIQLAVNFFWSIFFFNLRWFGFAFFWLAGLWILILLMILAFRRVDPIAALLQIPYLLWVSFAGYLNFAVWMLNR